MQRLSREASKQAELWGRNARDWAALQEPLFVSLWSTALDIAGAGPGSQVLDAGCGSGGACALAAARGATVFGIDPSVNMITIARERLPGADFRIAELADVPYPNEKFDAALAINVLPFTSDPKLAVHELGRVVKPGGRVVIAVFAELDACDLGVVTRAIRELFDRPPASAGPFALSSPEALPALVGAVTDLKFDSQGEVESTYEYPDLETALRAMMSAGGTGRAVEILGGEKVREAVRGALEQLRSRSGTVRMNNRFRVAAAIRTSSGRRGGLPRK